jgi:hypothetical protein
VFFAFFFVRQLHPSGSLKDRMSWKGYRSGHMMYLRKQDLETANDDISVHRCPKLGNQQSINGSYLIALTIFSKISTADPFQ